jgi:hypothetical protein
MFSFPFITAVSAPPPGRSAGLAAAFIACRRLPMSSPVHIYRLTRLSKCGGWGRHPQNMERDLHTFCSSYLALSLEKYYAPAPARSPLAVRPLDHC